MQTTSSSGARLCLAACVLVAGASHADAIREPTVERIEGNRIVVKWSGKGPVDVYVGERPRLEASAMHLISDDDMDGRHEYEAGDRARPYFLLKSERDGSIRRVAERVIALERGSNFRDVGGYRTSEGKHVRWGLIYRTGAMPQLTDRDYQVLNQLGIRVFCDLRSVEERVLAPTRSAEIAGSRYVAVDYPAETIYGGLVAREVAASEASVRADTARATNMYRDWPTSLAPQYKQIFAALIAGEAPLAFNCSAGQDRTGVATALVLTALGVPRETILEDYHLSTLLRRPEFERGIGDYQALAATNIVARFHVESQKRGPEALKPRPLFDEAGRARLLATFEEIEQRWGSVDRYLAEVLDVDASDALRLRALYLE